MCIKLSGYIQIMYTHIVVVINYLSREFSQDSGMILPGM